MTPVREETDMTIPINPVSNGAIWPSTPIRTGIAPFLTAFINEIEKSLLHAWAARKGMAVELPLFILFYFAINLYMGRGQIHNDLLAPTLIGLTAVMFFHQQLNRVFWGMLGEIQAGTLEQLYLSPLPTPVLVLGR